jgi:hypothetical protein
MPAALEVTATSEDGVIQGVMHKSHPVHGVQFHPESIAVENGHALLGQFPDHRARLRKSPGMKVTSASVDFPAALAIVREGGSLDADASARVFETIMAGEVPEADLTNFLTAQAVRGPTVAEIVGAVRAMRAGMRPVSAPEGAIDLCGTGGDGHGTLNISTAVSFVVAGAGVPVAKHGNRSGHLQKRRRRYSGSAGGEDRFGTGARLRRFGANRNRLFVRPGPPSRHAPCRKSAQPDQDAHHFQSAGAPWPRLPG